MDVCNISDTSMESQFPIIASPRNTNVHAQLYKKNPDINKQHERRQALLKLQRDGRNTSVDSKRSILDIIDEEEGNKLDENNKVDENSCLAEAMIVNGPCHRRTTFGKYNEHYGTQLMLSEWCIGIPPNFELEWLMKLCPKGQRTLVIASRGRTRAYDKRGNLMFMFRSELPGGKHGIFVNESHRCRTVIDCIYNDSNRTFYVLDVLAWRNQETTNCDTQFRFSWLQSKFAEMPKKSILIPDVNTHIIYYSFIPLPFFDCTAMSLSNALSTWPLYLDNPNIDGMLFYHKGTTYTAGETPLVLWLKTFMVPELFGMNIAIAEQYINCRPDNYSGQQNYIEEFRRKLHSKRFNKNRANRKNLSSFMDTCEPGQSNSSAELEIENVNMEENNTSPENDCNMLENVCTMES